MLPRSGDVLRVTRAASVQFASPLLFRVIRVQEWDTYDGWCWLDGYELDSAGEAVERRTIFVQVDGLQPAPRGAGPLGAAPAQRRSSGPPVRSTPVR